MRILRPFAAGTVLSTGAASGLACLDPGPSWGFPHLSARHPLASYTALAAAPLGNGWELFALVAFVMAACFAVSGWRTRRRPEGEQEARQ